MSLPPALQEKLRRHDGRVWCGSLTPTEIIDLVDEHGCKPTPTSQLVLRRMRDFKDKGLTESWWFYFTPPDRLGIVERLHHGRAGFGYR